MSERTMVLIGIGGAGGRVVNDTATLFGLDPESVIAIDTDIASFQSLNNCRRHCIGQSRFNGNGTAGDANLAASVAEDEKDTLVTFLSGIHFAVVVAGLGGGSGSGITPVVLQLARERNIPTLVFTLSPFSFEGEDRRELARRTRPMLEECGSVVVHFDNDRLAAAAPTDIGMEEVRRFISRFAAEGISLFWRLVNTPGYIGLDLATICSLLRTCHGRAHFAFATAQGENRVEEVAGAMFAPESGALSNMLSTAPAVAVGILGGADLRLKEVGDAMAALRSAIPSKCRVHMGTVLEPAREAPLSIAALVFENWSGTDAGHVAALPVDVPEAPPVRNPALPTAGSGSGAPQPPMPEPVPRPTQRTSRKPGSKGLRTNPVLTCPDYFQHTESMVYNGESLDIPTYQRRGWNIQAE